MFPTWGSRDVVVRRVKGGQKCKHLDDPNLNLDYIQWRNLNGSCQPSGLPKKEMGFLPCIVPTRIQTIVTRQS